MKLRAIRVIIPIKAHPAIWYDDSTWFCLRPCQSLTFQLFVLFIAYRIYQYRLSGL